MPDLSGWTKAHPSATSRVRDLPSGYRSDKSHTRAAWEEEHYFEDGSAGSAGVHKLGSGVLPGRGDEGGISAGTASYELAIGTDTGRLYATGASLSYPQQLSAGTSFDLVVVGPESLATGDAWCISYGTCDTGSYVTWNAIGFNSTPYVLYNTVGPASSNDTVQCAMLQNVEASGGTFLGQALSLAAPSETSLEALPSSLTGYVTFVAIGQITRSKLS
jgi:hypothetical protein